MTMTIKSIVNFPILLGLGLAIVGCASTKVDTQTLTASAQAISDDDLAGMDCANLEEARLGLAEQISGATLKPNTVDYTDASQVGNAKDLKPMQKAASVGLTTVKSTIPGAGFIPLVTGSAFRNAARTSALGEANIKLARMEGVMLAKGCDVTVGEETASEEASVETDNAAEQDVDIES